MRRMSITQSGMRFSAMALLGALLLGALTSPVHAVVVASLDNPENSQDEPLNHNRFFASPGGFTINTDLTAADGNKFAGVTLAGGNDGVEDVGMIWALDIPEYETAGTNTNGGTGLGKELENGDVIRYTLWMATDPNDPLLNEGEWTDSIKFELTEVGLSGGSGAEVYDTGNDLPEDFTAGNCNIASGEASCTSHATPEIVSTGWTQFSVQYEIDDFDFSSGTVDDVVHIRAVMFLGDFQSAEAIQGTVYIDNMSVEIFDDIAAANASPPDPTYPGGHLPSAGVSGDFDGDGDVDGADFLTWQRDLGDASSLGLWEGNFGTSAANVAASNVPEPSSALLALLALGSLSIARKKRIDAGLPC